MNEYIIINKTSIQKRIEELEKERLLELKDDFYDSLYLGEINALKQILSQSTPLILEIEKAYRAGYCYSQYHEYNKNVGDVPVQSETDYISNLKIDI